MNKKMILAFVVMIMSMTSTNVLSHGHWGGGYGIGVGYGLGWGWGGGYWGYPGWGGGYWGGYPGWGLGYPYYAYGGNQRAADDASYYAQRAKNASLRAQQAEERLAQVNRRKNLRKNNINRRNAPPHRYQTKTLPY
jgi:hypothetical protein